MDASAQAELARLEQLLDNWGHSPADVQGLSVWVETGCLTLRAALPPRYMVVLHDVLDRLQSSALFAEESCSFSQQDLLANLRIWARRAQETLT
mgnify:FL=1|jgi:hypothetical protein